MTVLYKSSVTEIGELVPSFIAEGMLVFLVRVRRRSCAPSASSTSWSMQRGK